jgi:hypothetical protein
LSPFLFFQHLDVSLPFAADLDLEAKTKRAKAIEQWEPTFIHRTEGIALYSGMELDSEGEDALKFPPPPAHYSMWRKELSDMYLVEPPRPKPDYTAESAPLLA